MQSQRWQDKQVSCGKLAQIFFICIAATFVVFIGVIWTLSTNGIISGVWATILTVAFAILTLLVAFLQWYVPRSSSGTQTPIALPEQIPPQQTPPLSPISAEDKAYSAFVESERKRVYESPNPRGTGTLVIRADKSLANETVVVEDKSAIISERTENGQHFYMGMIRDLKAGNHYATTSQRRPRGFTINLRDVTEIDLRNEN